MSNPDTHDHGHNEHTFGRDHFSPPPLASELEAQAYGLQASAQALPEDFDQRIRNIGEW